MRVLGGAGRAGQLRLVPTPAPPTPTAPPPLPTVTTASAGKHNAPQMQIAPIQIFLTVLKASALLTQPAEWCMR